MESQCEGQGKLCLVQPKLALCVMHVILTKAGLV